MCGKTRSLVFDTLHKTDHRRVAVLVSNFEQSGMVKVFLMVCSENSFSDICPLRKNDWGPVTFFDKSLVLKLF